MIIGGAVVRHSGHSNPTHEDVEAAEVEVVRDPERDVNEPHEDVPDVSEHKALAFVEIGGVQGRLCPDHRTPKPQKVF
jgi:hypothetical protein